MAELAALARAACAARRMDRGALEAALRPSRWCASTGDRVADIHLEGQTPAHSPGGGVHDRRERGRRAAPDRPQPPDGLPPPRGPGPEPRRDALRRSSHELGVATPPLPDGPLGPGPAGPPSAAAAAAVARHLRAGGAAREALWALVLRTLRQAYYSADARWATPGLASPAYLHFTSPIRRYPDLLVHRGLLDTLGPARRAAARARRAGRRGRSQLGRRARGRRGRAPRRRHLRRLPAARPPGRRAGGTTPVEGVVTGLIDAGLFVTFEGGVVTGFLPSRAARGRPLPRRPARGDADRRLVGARRIRLGDPIEVRVVRIEPLRGRVELEPAARPARPVAAARAVVPRSRRGRAGARPR